MNTDPVESLVPRSVQAVLDLYKRLPVDEQRAIVAFLKALKAPAEAQPADSSASQSFASAR